MLKNKKIIVIIIGIVCLFFALVFIVKPIRQGATVLAGVMFDKSIGVKNENGIVRIALLGSGGGEHEGPDLTDTIMIASLDTKNNRVSIFSIPRDFWIKEKDEKINTVYAHAKIEDKNTALSEITKSLSTISGKDIHYAFLIEFDGFVKVVDELGGIEVDVENAFVDKEYPVGGKEQDTCGRSEEELELLSTASSQLDAFPCRYKSISFEKGKVRMDGNTALEFVRSRHATGHEGTDFARSKRQQQILSAIKEKGFSLGVLANPAKVLNIYGIISDHIRTDISEGELDDFIKLAQKMKEAQIATHVLDYGDEMKGTFGLLKNPPIDKEYRYQWVLVPRKGNGEYSEIKEYISCIESGATCDVGENSILTPTIKTEKKN